MRGRLPLWLKTAAVWIGTIILMETKPFDLWLIAVNEANKLQLLVFHSGFTKAVPRSLIEAAGDRWLRVHFKALLDIVVFPSFCLQRRFSC